jgi:hypothetical protein
MIDSTNSTPLIASVATNAPALISNASVLPALVGGILVHTYHIIVNGGGLKRLGSNFWNGAPQPIAAQLEAKVATADLAPVVK